MMKYAYSGLVLLRALAAAVAVEQFTKLPLVDSEALQGDITKETILGHAKALEDIAFATPDRNRVMGSPGHQGTIDYLLAQFEPLLEHFDVTVQEFPVIFWRGTGALKVGDLDTGELSPFRYSPTATITGQLVHIEGGGCDMAEFGEEVKGKIALISRATQKQATCGTSDRAVNAGEAGAIGAVLYNDVPGRPIGSYRKAEPGKPAYVPAIGIRLEPALEILAELEKNPELEVTINIDALTEERITANVIAQTKRGDQENVLVVGAHSDSVGPGPGINDNGSGTCGILTVAQNMANWEVKNAVRFTFWGGEEFGLLGSTYYVKTLPPAELAKIRLYLNFDMIASPNFFLGVYDGDGDAHGTAGPPGSDKVEAFFHSFFADTGFNSSATAFTGRSDYGPFIAVDVPAGGLFTGAEGLKSEAEAAMFGGEAGVAYDVNYHYPGDTFENLNADAFLINTRAIAASTAYYALDMSEIPVRDLDAVETLVRRAEPLVLPMVADEDFHGSCGEDWD